MNDRHYVAWIDADSIVPTNTRHVEEALRALRKDVACIIVATNREAFHATQMGFHVIRLHFYPMGGEFSAAPVLCISDTEYMELVVPFPWSRTQAVAGCRSSLSDAARARLIPLAHAGLI